MSKTIKHVKTKGALDRIQKTRKDRKLARSIRIDELIRDLHISPANRTT